MCSNSLIPIPSNFVFIGLKVDYYSSQPIGWKLAVASNEIWEPLIVSIGYVASAVSTTRKFNFEFIFPTSIGNFSGWISDVSPGITASQTKTVTYSVNCSENQTVFDTGGDGSNCRMFMPDIGLTDVCLLNTNTAVSDSGDRFNIGLMINVWKKTTSPSPTATATADANVLGQEFLDYRSSLQ